MKIRDFPELRPAGRTDQLIVRLRYGDFRYRGRYEKPSITHEAVRASYDKYKGEGSQFPPAKEEMQELRSLTYAVATHPFLLEELFREE